MSTVLANPTYASQASESIAAKDFVQAWMCVCVCECVCVCVCVLWPAL